MRDRRRAREATRHPLQTATCRLNAVLLRQDIRDTGRATWGPAPRRWLRAVVCPTPAPPRVFPADVRAVTQHPDRLQRLAQALQEPVTAWRLAAVVAALPARRGVQVTGALTTVAALGDLTRVDHPRPLRKDRGLTPSASARGARRRQGGLTQTGNPQARRALGAGAWAERDPAQVRRPLQRRLETLPKPSPDGSWKAQVRPGYTRSAAQGPGAQPASGCRRDGPGAQRVYVGHGPAGHRHPLATAAVWSLPRASQRVARSRATVP